MRQIISLKTLKEELNHPYRNGEFLIVDGNIVEVPDNDNDIVDILVNHNNIYYNVNWEDKDLTFDNGKNVPTVY